MSSYWEAMTESILILFNPKIKKLSLNNISILNLYRIGDIFPNLETLEITNPNFLNFSDFAVLSNRLPKLEELEIDLNQDNLFVDLSLIQFPNLKKFEFGNNSGFGNVINKHKLLKFYEERGNNLMYNINF